jgi:hypothetical protein
MHSNEFGDFVVIDFFDRFFDRFSKCFLIIILPLNFPWTTQKLMYFFDRKLYLALFDRSAPLWYTLQAPSCPAHSGGNDRFCARLKTDISASNSGLRGRTRSCLTFWERGRRDESKMVRHDLRWPWRPELKAEMSVFNLAQKRSFPPLCAAALLFLEKPADWPSHDHMIRALLFLEKAAG